MIPRRPRSPIRSSLVLSLLVLLAPSAVLTRAADSASAAQPSPRYLDTQAPIDERIADLIGRFMAIQTCIAIA